MNLCAWGRERGMGAWETGDTGRMGSSSSSLLLLLLALLFSWNAWEQHSIAGEPRSMKKLFLLELVLDL